MGLQSGKWSRFLVIYQKKEKIKIIFEKSVTKQGSDSFKCYSGKEGETSLEVFSHFEIGG